MYRLQIFVFLLGLSSSMAGWKMHHEDYHNHNPERNFNKLAEHMFSMDKKIVDNCRGNTYRRVREVYGTDSYALKYSVQGFEAKDIAIKIKNRVIYVSAGSFESVGSNSFWDLNILPDNLNTEEASWFLRDGELQISFPYRVPFGEEIRKSCGNISYSVYEVPMKVLLQEEKQLADDKVNTEYSSTDGSLITN